MHCEGPGQQAEYQVITEREGEQTDQEFENDEVAAETTGFGLGDKDTGPRQVKLRSHRQVLVRRSKHFTTAGLKSTTIINHFSVFVSCL